MKNVDVFVILAGIVTVWGRKVFSSPPWVEGTFIGDYVAPGFIYPEGFTLRGAGGEV